MDEVKNIYEENGFDRQPNYNDDGIDIGGPVEELIFLQQQADRRTQNKIEKEDFFEMAKTILYDQNLEGVNIPDYCKNNPDLLFRLVHIHPELLEQSIFNNDLDSVRNAVSINPECFQYASENLKNDKKFIKSLLTNSQNYVIAEHLGESVSKDTDFLKELTKINPKCTVYFDGLDRDTVMDALEKDGSIIDKLPDMQKDEEAIRVAAVTHPEVALKYATENISKDKEFLRSLLNKADGRFEVDAIFSHADESIQNDPLMVELGLEKGGSFKYVSPEYKKDKDAIMDFLEKGYDIVPKFIDPSLYTDQDFMRKALDYNCQFYTYMDKNDPEAIKTILSQQDKLELSSNVSYDTKDRIRDAIKEIPAEMWKNDEVRAMLEPSMIFELSDDSKKVFAQDKDILLNIGSKGGNNLLNELYRFDGPLHDKDFCRELIENNPDTFSSMDDFKGDKDIALLAISQSPKMSVHMSPQLRNDENFAKELININPMNYYAMSDRVKRMPEIKNLTLEKLTESVLEINKQAEEKLRRKNPDKNTLLEEINIGTYENENILQKFPNFRNDPDIVKAAIQFDIKELEDSDLKSNKEFVLKLFDEGYSPERYIDPNLYKDHDVAMKIMDENPLFYSHLCSHHPKDEEMAKMAVSFSQNSLRYVDKDLIKKDFMIELSKLNPDIINTYTGSAYYNDKDFVLSVVNQKGSLLQWVHPDLKKDIDVAAVAVNNDPTAFKYVSHVLHDHYGLAILAAKMPSNLKHVSDTLKSDPQFCEEFFNEAIKYNPDLSDKRIQALKDLYINPIKTTTERENEKKDLDVGDR